MSQSNLTIIQPCATGSAVLPLRLQRIAPFLTCPTCKGDLDNGAESFTCRDCKSNYQICNGKIYFIDPLAAGDALDVIKHRLKKYLGLLYYTIGVTIIAPSFPFNYAGAIRRHVNPRHELVVDLGCGNHRIDDDIVTLDATDYGAVDIVARLEALPLKTGSINALCSRSVLEHIPDVDGALAEMVRCTRPGGLGLHFVPFMFPFHASPYDFRRWTYVGARQMFQGWHVLEQRATAGPVSLFLICFLEFISALLSFGSERIKAVVYLLLCLLVFPFKLLDAPFIGRKAFIGLAPTILTVFQKP
jgi:SAM-dependent methyltransferase